MNNTEKEQANQRLRKLNKYPETRQKSLLIHTNGDPNGRPIILTELEASQVKN